MTRLLILALYLSPAVANAEEFLQRGPTSGRGIVALAIVSWLAASFAIVGMMRRSTQNPPAADAPLGPNASAAGLSGAAVLRMLGVVGGILVVVGAGSAMHIATRPTPVLPAGWTIVRPPQDIFALALHDSTLWAGGTAGVFSINRRTGALVTAPSVPAFRFVRDLLVDREGALWVAHGSGVARFAGGSWRAYSAADGLPNGAAKALLQDRGGAVWVGTDAGVFRSAGGRFLKTHAASASVIFQAQDGVIWCGSDDPEDGGLHSFDGASWRAISVRDGLAHPSVNAIAQDRDGALWFATGFSSTGGATRHDTGVWTTWTRDDGLAGGKVRSVFADASGRLWFGSEYDGIAVIDGSQRRVLTPRDGLAGFEVKEMVQDAAGVYWLATENGISRIEQFHLSP